MNTDFSEPFVRLAKKVIRMKWGSPLVHPSHAFGIHWKNGRFCQRFVESSTKGLCRRWHSQRKTMYPWHRQSSLRKIFCPSSRPWAHCFDKSMWLGRHLMIFQLCRSSAIRSQRSSKKCLILKQVFHKSFWCKKNCR